MHLNILVKPKICKAKTKQNEKEKQWIYHSRSQIHLPAPDRIIRQSISKDKDLNIMINKLDLVKNTWNTEPSNSGIACFASVHGTLSKINLILSHKSDFSQL